LTRCRWQTLDSFHPRSDAVPGTGVSCLMERVCGAGARRVTSYDRRRPRSLPASPWDRITAQTLQVARATCPKGHPSRRRRAALGPRATPPTCAALCAPPGRPAAAPAPLALLSVRPCAAGRSAAQAADAVRARSDWPDALALAWTAPGCAASGRSACRPRPAAGPGGQPGARR
jgi:hypothetical protein